MPDIIPAIERPPNVGKVTRGAPRQISHAAVLQTDEACTFDERIDGYRHQFRLNIDPWDLQRIIAEANRIGREGVEVIGFGYDCEAQSIVLGPKQSK